MFHCSHQTGKGILRSMKGESTAVADIVPVDIPINVMIAVAWYTAVARPRQLMVYHTTTGSLNPFTWGEMGKWGSKVVGLPHLHWQPEPLHMGRDE